MKQFFSSVALFLAITLSVSAQSTDFNLNSKVPVDPSIRTGTLSNGLRYYVKQNAKPENRLELRLVVNAGSMQENDDQQGLAHFVEHMCFNGTKNFKKLELVNFLESIGVKFGAHLNAYTSFDETVYMLQLPTDKPEQVDKGFLVLEDWAHNVTFEDEEIEKERGVVVEEWRGRLGANERMMQKYFPVLLKDSRYAERLPIGKMEIIENCDPQLLRDFYKDWYRPDLMAVIAVGDMDAEAMEQKIKMHFNKLTMPANPRPRREYDIPDNEEPLVSVASDAESQYTAIQMFIKHPPNDETTVGAYRESLKTALYSGMFNNRIREISQKPEAPFLFAQSSYGDFPGRSKSAYISMVVPKENQIEEAFGLLLDENERVRAFGFTESELERQKKSVLAQYEKASNEADKTRSSGLANEYIRNFLTEEPIPGIKVENEYAQKFVPEITVEEINALAKKWITDENVALVATVKEAEGVKIPTEAELLAVIDASKAKKQTAYVDDAVDAPLMAEKPQGTKVISTEENAKFGYTELTFGNGVKVYVKSTDFKNDEILFSSVALGGASRFPDKDILAADFMTSIMNQSGFGEFDQTALRKKLAGNTANLSLTMSHLTHGTRGSASPKDLETLLQLNYQYFTNARKDSEAFETFVSNMKNQLKFMDNNPEIAFYKKYVALRTMNNPRIYALPPLDKLEALTLDDIYSVYEQSYKTANDFSFILVGNIGMATAMPLLETYIGGLPTSEAERNWVAREENFPAGVTDETVYKGQEEKSRVQLAFEGKFKWNSKNRQIASLVVKTLSIKLREAMREDQGGVYGVSARISTGRYPKSQYSLDISWGCSPDNVAQLSQTVLDEMAKIVAEGPTDTDIQKAKETAIKDKEANEKENGSWLGRLRGQASFQNEMLTTEEYKQLLDSITKKDLQKAAKKYFTPDHYVKVVLKPEKDKE